MGLQLQSDSLGWLTVPVKPGHTVTRGRLLLETGDAARLTEAGDPELVAGDRGAEVLIWATA